MAAYTNFSDPNAEPNNGGTVGQGINNSGTIVGYFVDARNGIFGFTDVNGTFTTLTDPHATGSAGLTAAQGINNTGTIVGQYYANQFTGLPDGFIAVPNGSGGYIYTTIADPNAAGGTNVNGINDSGEIVGSYINGSNATVSFTAVKNAGGTYTETNIAGPAGSSNVTVAGLNNAGDIVGSYMIGGKTDGFVGVPNGTGGFTYTTLSYGTATFASAINNNGLVVGYYNTGSSFFGFEYNTKTGVETMTVDPNGTANTEIFGVNDAGTFTGKYDDNSSGNTYGFVAVPCFCPGTMIATDSGETAVEALSAGDLVATAYGAMQRVKGIERRSVDFTGMTHPELVWPVRVAAGAFGAGQPRRDLFLSPDHAVFVDGVLVPVRQLVNDDTIRSEPRDRVDYYHVELERHDVILAEGLTVESWLDIGDADALATSDMPSRYRAAGACAELVAAPERIRPIWQRLRARSLQTVAMAGTTTEPELHLSLDGRALEPMLVEPGRAVFALPRGTREVRLVSRATAPSDLRPWLDDRRRLGVAVSRIVSIGETVCRTIAMDDPSLASGWWDVERDGGRAWRWTDGNALIRLPEGCDLLEVRMSGMMEHAVEGSDRAALALAA